MTVYRVVWIAAMVLITAAGGVMGAIIVPQGAVLALCVCGVMLGGAARTHLDHERQRWFTHTRLAAGVVAGVLGTVVLVGLSALGGGGAVVGAVAIAAGSPARVRALSRRRGSTRQARADRDEAADELQRDVRALTDDQLCAAWRQSARALQTARRADHEARLVVVRQSFLDEMERRDPIGFSSWLEADALAGHDPSRYLDH